MYSEKDVFERLQKFLNNNDEEIKAAHKVHNKLKSLIPEGLRNEAYYRYLELGGTIGLNIKNYKIYEYSHNKKEAFRLIYPNEDLENLKGVNLGARIDFKNISIPCSLLEVAVEDFKKFTEVQWMSFMKAVNIAYNGRDNPVGNIKNIQIQW